VKGILVESERPACDTDAIGAYFQTLGQCLSYFLACLIINLDETGYQEWVDAHAESVIAPSKCKGKMIHPLVYSLCLLSQLFGQNSQPPRSLGDLASCHT
jgi:hypothetical protein